MNLYLKAIAIGIAVPVIAGLSTVYLRTSTFSSYMISMLIILVSIPLLQGIDHITSKIDKKYVRIGTLLFFIFCIVSLWYFLTIWINTDFYEIVKSRAKEKNDVRICNKIGGLEWYYYTNWLAIFTEHGKRYSARYYEYCIKDFSGHIQETIKKDPTICERIENQKTRDLCNRYNAEIKNDSSVCEKIVDQSWKDQCYYGVGVSKQDAVLCEEIEGQGTREGCYLAVAKLKYDSSLCEKPQEKKMREECYYQVAKLKQDPTICGKLEVQMTKDLCYHKVAESKQDSRICERIEGNKDHCYYKVAELKKDSTICEQIQDLHLRSNCYANIAIENKIPHLCNNVISKDRDYCYSAAW